MQKYGITFVIRTLAGGGAERVLSLLANHFALSGRDVTVITSIPKKKSDEDVFSLHPSIKRVIIPFWSIEIPFWKNNSIPNLLTIGRLKKEIIKAGNKIVIPFMEKSIVPVVFCLNPDDYRIIGALRAHPRKLQPGFIKRKLWKRYYKKVNTLVGLSWDWLNEFDKGTLVKEKYTVIQNFFYSINLNIKPSKDVRLPERFICAVGRLHAQKGYDMLIPIFARISKDYPDLHLVIFGEGEERENLEYMIRSFKIEHRVHLPGFVANPHAYVKKAEAFVFPSRHEGMPVALIEMLSIGMPVVSFDCPSGPGDLIKNNENGLLIERENPAAFEVGLRELLADPQKAERLGRQAQSSPLILTQDYAFAKWDALINFGQMYP